MKKFTISFLSITAAFFVSLLPMSGIANTNPFLQLVKGASAPITGECGNPGDKDFCSCFTKAIIDGCKSQPVHPQCTPAGINEEITALLAEGYNYAQICSDFHSPVPASECTADLKYWHSTASCRAPSLS
ncbi:hypothetical protein [Candidiatus Paracoxiella cheracis]|uniref:hypothetical protein n=1 Tax=Candidiatus Paracoxiella cheracis TaxID=3405120 RepID=UPI003BF5801C